MSQKHCCCPRHTPKLRSGSPTQPAQNPRLERCGRGAPQSFRHPARTGWPRLGRGMELAAGTLWTGRSWPTFARQHLQEKHRQHNTLLQRIPAFTGLQSAWLLLLFCASPCAPTPSSSCFRRAPLPSMLATPVATCLGTLLHRGDQLPAAAGTGFATCRPRSAAADHCAAYGASWRDTLPQSVLVPHRSPRTSCTRSLHLIVVPAAPLRSRRPLTISLHKATVSPFRTR